MDFGFGAWTGGLCLVGGLLERGTSDASSLTFARDDGTMPLNIMISEQEEIAAYRAMLLIRRFEEKAGQLYALGAIHGPCPLCIGQEGTIVGTLMASAPADKVVAGPRSHGALLARGVAPDVLLGELLGRQTGLSRGQGGTLHLASPAHGVYGGFAVAGASALIGTGMAFAARYRHDNSVTFCFFSDGASRTGRVFEAYQLAKMWRLPVVFVINRNSSYQADQADRTSADGSNAGDDGMARADAEIPQCQVDGIDLRRARAAALDAATRARAGEGPTILEMMTHRYRGHGGAPARAGGNEKRNDEADPITRTRARLIEGRMATDAILKGLEKEVRDAVSAAAIAAKAAPMAAAWSGHDS